MDENTNPTAAEKLKALQAAMAKIEKDFGKGSVMKMGDIGIENVDDLIGALDKAFEVI